MLNADRFGGMNRSCSVNYATADTSAQAGTALFADERDAAFGADFGTTGSKTVTVPSSTLPRPSPRASSPHLSGNSAGTGLTASQKASILIEPDRHARRAVEPNDRRRRHRLLARRADRRHLSEHRDRRFRRVHLRHL